MNQIQPLNTKKTVYGVVIVLVILLILAGLVSFLKTRSMAPSGPVAEYIPEERILKNATYGFEITTPYGINAEAPFKKFYILSDEWRLNAPAGSQGIPLVAIPIIRMDNGDVAATSSDSGATSTTPRKIYPLFYDVELRIGVSSSTADCLKAGPGEKAKDAKIGGYTFKKFTFSDAAMMKYISSESYRTVRNDLCYAIELIKVGSSYKEPNMDEALTQKDMDAYYALGGDVLKTFMFTR